jgi:hypothetical protein
VQSIIPICSALFTSELNSSSRIPVSVSSLKNLLIVASLGTLAITPNPHMYRNTGSFFSLLTNAAIVGICSIFAAINALSMYLALYPRGPLCFLGSLDIIGLKSRMLKIFSSLVSGCIFNASSKEIRHCCRIYKVASSLSTFVLFGLIYLIIRQKLG